VRGPRELAVPPNVVVYRSTDEIVDILFLGTGTKLALMRSRKRTTFGIKLQGKWRDDNLCDIGNNASASRSRSCSTQVGPNDLLNAELRSDVSYAARVELLSAPA
jgi:hypothetical protein